MNKEIILPPEVKAIPLPKGYVWDMYYGDPRACRVGEEHRSGWIDTNGCAACNFEIRLPNGQRVAYPEASVLELCQALANHIWLMEWT